ncbi:hypothetical protein IV203_007980 [Nitzschia inconspicua]|uniref:Uncharacterized protein n=1 Tax=Nitzschia inconspicua TaxID=303405 RepID=A0A9K3KXT9_9STRA|nr:hypothetical protein IV203_007980 [Nitzschia inconspicua]
MAETFSPYQIDFNVQNTSKTFGFSKKKITFKFGVANNQALADGMTGANCRGSEHEVIFTWSLNSGKRQILADGKDVHYSETGQNGWTADQVFQHHFSIRVPGLSGSLRAHLITQPANRDVPQIKPFDLRINGLSYFSMPKIFQLGTPQMVTRPVHKSKRSSRGGTDDDAYLTPEERKAIAAAKLASLRDLQQSQNTGPPPAPAPAATEGDLINFFDDPTPAPPPPQAAAPGGSGYFSAPPDGSGYYGAPPGQAPPPSYAQQPYSNYSLGNSLPPSAPPPPQQQSFSNIQSPFASTSSFGSAPPPAAPAPFGQPPAPAGYPPQQQQQVPSQVYGYQQQAPPPMQFQSQSSFGSLPQAAQPSPSNQTMTSYQSYGSAPTFAQPPQYQQQQQQTPQYQQQQYPPYGAPPAPPQGYPQY